MAAMLTRAAMRAPAVGATARRWPTLPVRAGHAAPLWRRSLALRASDKQHQPESDSAADQAAAAALGASASGPAAVAAVEAPAAANADASPFLDPLVRSLILGVGAGIACEGAHVAYKAMALAASGALPHPFTSVAFQAFSPAFFADHAVAIGAWLLLYAVEAAAIASVLRSNPDKPAQELAGALSGLPVLPRKMFPASLTPVKDAVAHTLAAGAAKTGAAPAAGDARLEQELAAASAAPAQLVAAPQGLSKELERTLEDIERKAAGDSRDAGDEEADTDSKGAGTTTLPRPKVPEGAPQVKPRARAPPATAPGRKQQQQQQQGERERQGGAGRQARREQELAERKAYLKNFWYAAALSSNVKADAPLGVDILGSRISLFRDEAGAVVAVDDTCPHRGAPLSAGWTATDKASGKKCLVCPYHGWAFDAEGKLRDVPSAEKGSWPQRPLIGSHPVQERGGFVWLFYGEPGLPAEERPPIPFTPELEDPAWRAVYGEIEFDCGHWGVFENAIDMAHIHYLHADSFGNSEQPKVLDMSCTRDTFETSCSFRIHNKPVNKLWEWTRVPSVPVTARAMLPSTSAVHIELAHGVRMITFVNTVPISENRAINRFCLIRNFATSPAFDFMARDNMYKILGEDKVMVDRLAPERLAVEYSLAPDMPQIAFRQLRQEWIDMGYGVPPESKLPHRGLLPPQH